MARLGSQAKAGFYPTPESVCGQLKQLLDIEEGARILDPCCGDRQTLAALAEGTGAITYGIELDHDRATEATTTNPPSALGRRPGGDADFVRCLWPALSQSTLRLQSGTGESRPSGWKRSFSDVSRRPCTRTAGWCWLSPTQCWPPAHQSWPGILQTFRSMPFRRRSFTPSTSVWCWGGNARWWPRHRRPN